MRFKRTFVLPYSCISDRKNELGQWGTASGDRKVDLKEWKMDEEKRSK